MSEQSEGYDWRRDRNHLSSAEAAALGYRWNPATHRWQQSTQALVPEQSTSVAPPSPDHQMHIQQPVPSTEIKIGRREEWYIDGPNIPQLLAGVLGGMATGAASTPSYEMKAEPYPTQPSHGSDESVASTVAHPPVAENSQSFTDQTQHDESLADGSIIGEVVNDEPVDDTSDDIFNGMGNARELRKAEKRAAKEARKEELRKNRTKRLATKVLALYAAFQATYAIGSQMNGSDDIIFSPDNVAPTTQWFQDKANGIMSVADNVKKLGSILG